MMAAQQENISHDNAGYLYVKRMNYKSTMLFGPSRDFFFFLTNFIFRTVVMPKSSFHFFLPEEYPDKSKKAVWIKLIA